MSVEIKQFAKIITIDEKEFEGEVIAGDLVAIKSGEEVYYGKPTAVRLKTRVECENSRCEKGELNSYFEFQPKVIEFDDNGDQKGFLEDATEIITLTNFKNERIVLCSGECAAAYLRRTHKLEGNILHFPEKKVVQPVKLLVPDRS